MKAEQIDWNDPDVYAKIDRANRLFRQQRRNEALNKTRALRRKKRRATEVSRASNRH